MKNDHKVTSCRTVECYLTVGSQVRYGGRTVSYDELCGYVSQFQIDFEEEHGYFCSVRILRSEVIVQKYYEMCYDIHVVNYPRFPFCEDFIFNFARCLTKYLLVKMDQNRISLFMSGETEMYEASDSENKIVHSD